MHEVAYIIYGNMSLRNRVSRLKRARRLYAAKLAEAEATVEGLKADLLRIDNALADCAMLGGKHKG